MLTEFKEQLEERGETYLKIKVRPGATRNQIREIMADKTIKIDIAAPAIRGRANQELIKFLAKEFEIRKNNVKIIKGGRDKIKIVKIIHPLAS